MSIEQSLERIATALEAIASTKREALDAIIQGKPKADTKPKADAKPAETQQPKADAKPGPDPRLDGLKKRALKLWDKRSKEIKEWCTDKGAVEGKISNLDPQHFELLDAFLATLEAPASTDI